MAFPSLFSGLRARTDTAFLPPNTRAPSVIGAQPPTFARGREVAALVLWTFAVFLGLALASYAGDPQIPLGARGFGGRKAGSVRSCPREKRLRNAILTLPYIGA